jgi:hypothetical protein
VSASAPLTVDVAWVAAPMGEVPPREAPAALADAMEKQLRSRNLQPHRVPAAEWGVPFDARDLPEQRAGWLVARPGAADAVLLADLSPRYFGFVNGRYRWTVTAELWLVDPDDPTHAVTDRFEVPAYLTWDHERDDAALVAAAPLVGRHLDDLVEDWLGGR